MVVPSKETLKETNGETEKKGAEATMETDKKEEIEAKREKENKIELPSFDIDKVLAETSVPELSSDIEHVMIKKSVKFSPVRP